MSCLLASDQYWKQNWFKLLRPSILEDSFTDKDSSVVIGPTISKIISQSTVSAVQLHMPKLQANLWPQIYLSPSRSCHFFFYEPIIFVSLMVCLVNKCLFTFYVTIFTSLISHVSILCVKHLLFIHILAIRHHVLIRKLFFWVQQFEFVSWVCFSLGANEYFGSACLTKLIFWFVIVCKHSTMIGSFSDNSRY